MTPGTLAPEGGALVINPCVELVRRRREGELREISVVAPVRGGRLRMTRVARAREPEVFEVAARIAAREGAGEAIDAAVVARLVDIGLLVPAAEAPARVRFACPLEGPPRALVPRRAPGPPVATPRGRLRVAASLRYMDAVRPPDEARVPKQTLWLRDVQVARPEVNPFAEGWAWAFFDHAEAEAPGVISVAEGERALYRRLVPGEAPPGDVPDGVVARLAEAGVLVDPEEAGRRRRAREAERAALAARLAREDQAILRGLIHPVQLAAMRRYARALVAEGHLHYGDAQVARRYWAHNEALARWLLRRLAPLVSEMAGKPMQPAFLFFASYRPGAELPPHRDRDPCHLSVNVMLDYDPEPEGASPWPLFVAARGEAGRAADLALGDALFYRGKVLRHWRDALPEGHASTSVILNYADAGYSGPLD